MHMLDEKSRRVVHNKLVEISRMNASKKISSVLDKNESLCLDNKRDKEYLIEMLLDELHPFAKNDK